MHQNLLSKSQLDKLQKVFSTKKLSARCWQNATRRSLARCRAQLTSFRASNAATR